MNKTPFFPKIFLEIFLVFLVACFLKGIIPPFWTPKTVGRGGGIRRGEGCIGV